MSRMRPLTLALCTTLVGLTACNDSTSPELGSLGSAFSTATAGFEEVSSSFSPEGGVGLPWQPERGRGGPGGIGGPGMSGFMGGALDRNFGGGVEAGRGAERGPFASGDITGCVFAAATGDITCGPTVRGGLTVTRVISYKTLTGTAQSRLDSTTSSVRTRVTANGTVQRRDSVTSTVRNASDRTVTGMHAGSALRTVNGTAQGSESSTGKTRDGLAFSSERIMGDTSTGVTVPVENGRPTYPTAGTVVRSMRVAMTVDGKSRTSTRREVITYNGSATATLVITHDGTSKTCSLPLPMGRPTCTP